MIRYLILNNVRFSNFVLLSYLIRKNFKKVWNFIRSQNVLLYSLNVYMPKTNINL
jgi:hypothetical protein